MNADDASNPKFLPAGRLDSNVAFPVAMPLQVDALHLSANVRAASARYEGLKCPRPSYSQTHLLGRCLGRRKEHPDSSSSLMSKNRCLDRTSHENHAASLHHLFFGANARMRARARAPRNRPHLHDAVSADPSRPPATRTHRHSSNGTRINSLIRLTGLGPLGRKRWGDRRNSVASSFLSQGLVQRLVLKNGVIRVRIIES
mgnify:CR=1 FL=1